MHRKLTYANVTATLALFISLGGVSYAATKLPKNSVGSAQIKANAVTSGKVKNGSLLSADFKAGEIPAGPAGTTGPKGDKGDPGTNGTNGVKGDKGNNGNNGATVVTYHVQQTLSVPNGSDADEEPSCGAGETLIGGGGFFATHSTSAIQSTNTLISASGPAAGTTASQTPSNWYVSGSNSSGGALDFIGYAVCASP